MESSEEFTRFIQEPTMSDKTITMDVEDFIALTFGPVGTHEVNFNMMQTVLYILARHMGLLERRVEITFAEDEQEIIALKQRLVDGSLSSLDYSTKDKMSIKWEKSNDSRTASEVEDRVVERGTIKERTPRTIETATTGVLPKLDKEAHGKTIKPTIGKIRSREQSLSNKMDDDMFTADTSLKGDKKASKRSWSKIERKSKQEEAVDELRRLDESEDSGYEMDKKVEAKRVKKAKHAVADDDSSSLDISDDKEGNIENIQGKAEQTVKSTKIEMADSSLRQYEKKGRQSKGQMEFTKDGKSMKDSPIPVGKFVGPEDVGEKFDKKGKDKKRASKSQYEQKTETAEDSANTQKYLEAEDSKQQQNIPSRSVSVSERDDNTRRETMEVQRKKRTASAGALTNQSEHDVKKPKKKRKSENVEAVDDIVKIDDTEYSGKRKSKSKKMEALSKKESLASRQSKGGGIIVSEVLRKGGKGPKDTVLVVEKGPTTRVSQPRVGNIELVTRSQFELLKTDVEKLKEKSKPMPVPTTLHDEELKEDLASGSATVSGAMEAMKLNKRVKAAEVALSRMAVILGHLAADGNLPLEAYGLIHQLQVEQRELAHIISAKASEPTDTTPISQKTVGTTDLISQKTIATTTSVLPKAAKTVGKDIHPPTPGVLPKLATGKPQKRQSQKVIEVSIGLDPQLSSLIPPENPFVTRTELSAAIENMRNEMLKNMTVLTDKSSKSADQAQKVVKSAATRLEIVLAVKTRIEELKRFTTQQSEELNGFDSGLALELKKFQERLNAMRAQLKEGLRHLCRTERSESFAVSSLKTNNEKIELKIDHIMHQQADLLAIQKEMSEEFKNAIESVELLRDEKVERKELVNGLRVKVNISQLQGLLFEDMFEKKHKEIARQVELCFKYFEKQDLTWMGNLAKLSAVAKKKALLNNLYSLKSLTTDRLNNMYKTLCYLESMLGDHELALLTRRLSRDAHCGSCLMAAQMEPFDKIYSKPPPLPPLVPGDHLIKQAELDFVIHPPDEREHVCKRWVGGSHTMITRETAISAVHTVPPQLQTVPTTQYVGFGVDGHAYLMENDLQACIECNKVLKDKSQKQDPMEVGCGDQGGDQRVDQGPDKD